MHPSCFPPLVFPPNPPLPGFLFLQIPLYFLPLYAFPQNPFPCVPFPIPQHGPFQYPFSCSSKSALSYLHPFSYFPKARFPLTPCSHSPQIPLSFFSSLCPPKKTPFAWATFPILQNPPSQFLFIHFHIPQHPPSQFPEAEGREASERRAQGDPAEGTERAAFS